MAENVWYEARLSVRALLRDWSFAIPVVCTLTTSLAAIGIASAAFQTVVLDAVPGPNRARLVAVDQVRPDTGTRFGFSHKEAQELPAAGLLLQDWAHYSPTRVYSTPDAGSLQWFTVSVVSPNFFDIFGVPPREGRLFGPADAAGRQGAAIILSSEYAQTRFGRLDGVVGRSLNLGGVPFQIVGIMPNRFRMPTELQDGWLVDVDDPAEARWTTERQHRIIGLLRTDQTIAETSRPQITTTIDGKADPILITERPLRDELVGSSGRVFAILFGIAVVVALVALLNIVMLFLGRHVSRRRHAAIRQALGAPGAALVVESLAESAVLSVTSFLSATTIGVVGVNWLRTHAPEAIPRLRFVQLSPVVMGTAGLLAVFVTVGIALLTGRGVGLGLGAWLQTDKLSHVGAHRLTERSGRVLVVVQIAASLTLVLATAVMLHSLSAATQLRLGFDPEGLFAVQFSSAKRGDIQADLSLRKQVVEELARIPGVASVSTMRMIEHPSLAIVAAETRDGSWLPIWAEEETASQNLFTTLRTRVLAGRAFQPTDEQGACHVIVSDSFRRMAWPGSLNDAALGLQVDRAVNLDGTRVGVKTGRFSLCEVVGVVEDIRQRIGSAPAPRLYYVSEFLPSKIEALLVRLRPEQGPSAGVLLDSIRRVDPERPVVWSGLMADRVRESIAAPKFYSAIMAVIVCTVLALTTFGVYSVMTEYVTQRQVEIGVRMALGASRGRVFLMIVGVALLRMALGVLFGLVGAFLAGGAIRALAENAGATSLAWTTGAVTLEIAVGLVGAGFPALQAARIQTAQLLKTA